ITIDKESKILFVNQAAENIFGYSVAEMLDQSLSMIMPENLRPRHWASLKRYIDAGKTDMRWRAVQLPGLHKSGWQIPLEVSFGKFFKDGKHFFTCIIRDITARKRAEEQIKTSLKEKEVLLKEVHHRVKNNLQVISSMLNLQARHVKDQKALEMFRESQDRVRSVALIHEKLYQTKELSRIDFTEYIRNLGTNLVRTYGVNPDSIRLQIHTDGVYLSVDTAISCGLIINELVSNSLKYAFPAGQDGEIHIKLRSDKDNQFSLIVGDNGIGLPKDLDFRNTESLGLQLVTTLTDQIGGTVELDRDHGTAFRIVFTESKYRGGSQGNGKRAHPSC
ncbi:MAG: sensor histidine kinase, partial [Candidatus Binatia bacterium]